MQSFYWLLPVCLTILLTGCSSEEKVIKPQSRVAKHVEGDFQVEQLLINGRPPVEGWGVEPGEALKIDLKFVRNNGPSSGPLYCYVVTEQRETEHQAKGSHLILKQTAVACSSEKGRHSIEATAEAPSPELADFADKHALGRYFYLILAENGSEIVSQKIGLANK